MWWKATIWLDVLVFGPYYLAAIIAFIKGKGLDQDPDVHLFIDPVYQCIHHPQRGDRGNNSCSQSSHGASCKRTMAAFSCFPGLEDVEE